MIINLSDYHSFCFRGEGRANFVISAKNKLSGHRIVWRFTKQKKTGLASFKSKSQIVYHYMDQIISPLFTPAYMVGSRVVEFTNFDVHLLAKLPAIEENIFIEDASDLEDEDKYPREISLLKLDSLPRGTTHIAALEMLDATTLSRDDLWIGLSPTITFEIKPKQGFFQNHFNSSELMYCNNCVLQIEKWKAQAFDSMYDFCPLDLYSGNEKRMFSALESLVKCPHRNMRIFKDGIVVHSNEGLADVNDLEKIIVGKSGNGMILTAFIQALCSILCGIRNDQEEKFEIKEGSIISQLLSTQQVDTTGIVEAYFIYKKLPLKERRRLEDINEWFNKDIVSVFKGSKPIDRLWRYFLAATIKDCSIMISMQQISPDDLKSSSNSNIVTIHSKFNQNAHFYFTYSVKIVDLDPKMPKNLVNSYSRFIDGIQTLQNNPKLRRNCLIVN